jgi:signal transduction histidine kinase
MNIENPKNECSSEIEKLATNGIAELREAINDMKSNRRFSCVTNALQALADSTKGIEINVCIQGEDGEKYILFANIFYECARECVTNSLRYSGSDRIDIIVKLLENCAELYILDNGDGCENIVCGHGLNGITERVRAVGGKVDFSSQKGNGFKTHIFVPLEDKND